MKTSAQIDSAVTLDEFVFFQQSDTQFSLTNSKLSQSITSVLTYNPSSDIRFSGPGTLASFSFRGGSTSQTTVLWNGQPLESPTNAVADLALIPYYFIDHVSLGGRSSAVNGSGAISGVMHLMNDGLSMDDQFSMQLEQGSFGKFFLGANWTSGINHWRVRTRLFVETQENDFTFQNPGWSIGDSLQTLNHARRKSYGVLQEHQWNWQNNRLKLAMWFQDFEREIPPTMLEAQSGKKQHDRNARFSLNYIRSLEQGDFQSTTSYANEFLEYSDELAGLYYPYNNHLAIQSFQYRRVWGSTFQGGVKLEDRYNYSDAGQYYSSERNEFTPSIFASARIKHTNLQGALRKSYYLRNVSPVLFNFQFSHSLNSSKWLGQISRNYRLPSMNDLFWTPGGNPHLEPELSLRTEMSYVLEAKHVGLKSTVYLNKIHNQIRWIPSSGTLFEVAQSDKVTWNRGLELTLQYKDTVENWQFTPFINAYVLKSTQAQRLPKVFEGNQLTFVPLWGMNYGTHILTPKGIQFFIGVQHYSKRYTLTDQSDSLNQYALLNLSVKESITQKLTVQVDMYNLTNKRYVVLPFKAMPGINFNIKLIYQFKQ